MRASARRWPATPIWIFRGEVLPESAADTAKKPPTRGAPSRVTTGGSTPTPVQ